MKLLLDLGADPSLVLYSPRFDHYTRSALEVSLLEGDFETAEYLISRGGDVNQVGFRFLEDLCPDSSNRNSSQLFKECTTFLVNKGFDINKIYKTEYPSGLEQEFSILSHVTQYDVDMVRHLLDLDAKANLQLSNGHNALSEFFSRLGFWGSKSDGIAELLLSKGVRLNFPIETFHLGGLDLRFLEDLSVLGPETQNIKELNLYNTDIYNADISPVIDLGKQPNLTSISIVRSCDKMTDINLSGCPKLKIVDLRGCHGLKPTVKLFAQLQEVKNRDSDHPPKVEISLPAHFTYLKWEGLHRMILDWIETGIEPDMDELSLYQNHPDFKKKLEKMCLDNSNRGPAIFEYLTKPSGAEDENQLRIVKFFLDSGCDPHSTMYCNNANHPLLHLAARGGHHETMKLLIEHGVDVNAMTKSKPPALSMMASYITKLRYNVTSDRYQAPKNKQDLEDANSMRHKLEVAIATMDILLDSKADPTLAGMNPVHLSALERFISERDFDTAEYLISRGADIKKIGINVLRETMISASRRHMMHDRDRSALFKECAKFLLDKGVSVNEVFKSAGNPQGPSYETILTIAIDCHLDDVVEFLMNDHGARLDVTSPGGRNLVSAVKLDALKLKPGTLPAALPRTLKELKLLNYYEELTFGDMPGLESLTLEGPDVRKLNLSGCPNLRTVNLMHCPNLDPTPDLLKKLEEIEMRYDSQVTRPLSWPSKEEWIERAKKTIEDAIENSDMQPKPHAIKTLFHRFATEGMGGRTISDVVSAARPVIDLLEDDLSHLSWIEDISLGNIDGCVNQPIQKWLEVAGFAAMYQRTGLQGKVEASKQILVREELITFVNHILSPEKKPGAGVQVEFANALIREIHKMLLGNHVIKTPWLGIPGKVPYERTVERCLTKETIKEAYGYLMEKVILKNRKEIVDLFLEKEEDTKKIMKPYEHLRIPWMKAMIKGNSPLEQGFQDIDDRYKLEKDSLMEQIGEALNEEKQEELFSLYNSLDSRKEKEEESLIKSVARQKRALPKKPPNPIAAAAQTTRLPWQPSTSVSGIDAKEVDESGRGASRGGDDQSRSHDRDYNSASGTS